MVWMNEWMCVLRYLLLFPLLPFGIRWMSEWVSKWVSLVSQSVFLRCLVTGCSSDSDQSHSTRSFILPPGHSSWNPSVHPSPSDVVVVEFHRSRSISVRRRRGTRGYRTSRIPHSTTSSDLSRRPWGPWPRSSTVSRSRSLDGLPAAAEFIRRLRRWWHSRQSRGNIRSSKTISAWSPSSPASGHARRNTATCCSCSSSSLQGCYATHHQIQQRPPSSSVANTSLLPSSSSPSPAASSSSSHQSVSASLQQQQQQRRQQQQLHLITSASHTTIDAQGIRRKVLTLHSLSICVYLSVSLSLCFWCSVLCLSACVSLSLRGSVCLSLYFCLSPCRHFLSLSIHISMCLALYLCLSPCLYLYLSQYPCLRVSVYPPMSLFLSLSWFT